MVVEAAGLGELPVALVTAELLLPGVDGQMAVQHGLRGEHLGAVSTLQTSFTNQLLKLIKQCFNTGAVHLFTKYMQNTILIWLEMFAHMFV